MIRKPLVLILALLLPVSIFLFLHFYGKNEFEVSVFFQSPAEAMPPDCNMTYDYPYQVRIPFLQSTSPSVIFFASGLNADQYQESLFQLSRLEDEFRKEAPELFIVGMETDTLLQLTARLDNVSYNNSQKCIFLAANNRLVLVDGSHRIRGFYSDTSLKEVDRLILELKILFGQY